MDKCLQIRKYNIYPPKSRRYSWFQTWQKNTPAHPGANPGCSLTNHEGSALSELGQFYNSYKP